MSGLTERVIADWLTKTDERGYQAAFASALNRGGETVMYYSAHTAGELGKDIITLDGKRRMTAYQLKAGNITSSLWRNEIEGEIKEASEVPVNVPGLPSRLPSRVVLVCSGRIQDPVRDSIYLRNQEAKRRKFPQVEFLQRDELVSILCHSVDAFLPPGVESVRDLVLAHLAEGRGPFPIRQLHSLLWASLGAKSTKGQAGPQRAAADAVVVTQFAAHSFAEAENYISVLDAWTTLVCLLSKWADVQTIDPALIDPAVEIARQALLQAGESLISELKRGADFSSRESFADGFLLHFRKVLTLGYLAAAINSRQIMGLDVRSDVELLVDLLRREAPIGPWGEGSWNYYVNVVAALSKHPGGPLIAEDLIRQWIEYVCTKPKRYVPDPYWSAQDAIAALAEKRTDPMVNRDLRPTTFTAAPALDILIRRMRRQTIGQIWARYSRHESLEMAFPSEQDWVSLPAEVEPSQLVMTVHPMQGSWARLCSEQRGLVRIDPFGGKWPWILPFFLCAYPHRVGRGLSARLLDLSGG